MDRSIRGHGWDARETEEEDAFAAAEYLEEIHGETIQQEMEISLYDPENGRYVPYFSDLSRQSEPEQGSVLRPDIVISEGTLSGADGTGFTVRTGRCMEGQ